jgi:hypothetical protein
VPGQIGARLLADVSLEGRVAPPLGTLLSRMLARDPEQRFSHAGQALEAIGDLETAPVSLALFEEDPPTTRNGAPPDASFRNGAPVDPALEGPPRRSQFPLAPSAPLATDRSSVRPDPPPKPGSDAPAGNASPSKPVPGLPPGTKRLSRLARDPSVALVETLHSLDLAMVDALARRERGSLIARIARAVALALRLELDAAALILEPLQSQSDLARAFGATLIAPRCRRATRARVDAERTDGWVDSIDLELAAMLCALGTAMTMRDDATRNEARCRRVIERAVAAGGGAAGSTLTTVRMAQIAAGMVAGTTTPSSAIADVLRLRDQDREVPSPFLALVRALVLGLVGFRADEHLAREQLERATKIAAETGNTLLETRSIVAWGGMLVEISERVEQGLGVLERATTLLAHGDAPSLEHIAEHNRGAALVIQGRYSEAAPHLRRARSAAKGELSLEHEILSCMNEGLSHVALGDREASSRIMEELSDSRLTLCSARTAAYCHAVRSMYAMLFETPEVAAAELRRAHSRSAEAEAEGTDVYLLAEALGILYAAARHEEIDLLGRAGELQKLAQDRGFVSFYWFEVLRAMVGHIRDVHVRAAVEETLEKLVVLLGPAQMAARAS